jgi:hypothetical protein
MATIENNFVVRMGSRIVYTAAEGLSSPPQERWWVGHLKPCARPKTLVKPHPAQTAFNFGWRLCHSVTCS